MSSWAAEPRPAWAHPWACAQVAEALLAHPPVWSRWPFPRPTTQVLAQAIQAHPSDPRAILGTLDALDLDAWGELRDALRDTLAERLAQVHADQEADWVARQGLLPLYPIGYRRDAIEVVGHDTQRGRYHLATQAGQWHSVPYEALHGVCPSPAGFALRAPPGTVNG